MTLNEYTGRSDKSLAAEHQRLSATLDRIQYDDYAGGGGSPTEGLRERIADLADEMDRREKARATQT